MKRFLAILLLVAAVYFGVSEARRWWGATPHMLGSVDQPATPLQPDSPSRVLSPDIKALQDKDWGEFRIAFPGCVQTLAVSAPYPDGSRTLIASEPPPQSTLEGMKALDLKLLSTSEVMTHAIGHDGWVKDVVFNLPPGTDGDALTALVKQLSEYLFGTNYGAYALSLPINLESLHTKYPLDLKIGASDIQSWAADLVYRTVDGLPVGKLTDLSASGVYFSDQPGVVAWFVRNGVGFSVAKSDARRFALDSDLILGAAEQPNGGIAVFGRERVVPVDVMPPLRFETIELLAGAGTDKLAQSYERTEFFAGHFEEGWDWAPAFLSPQLIDTEYGNLLSIADQLLKSWTEHGTIRYQNFPYPDPNGFPFIGPLAEELKANSLLFNWNTTGVGYVADLGSDKIYGLNRTGALPVIYRPDDQDDASVIHGDVEQVKRSEEIGYDFFANQNDPALVRVVQYAAMYQAFQAFGVQATDAAKTSTNAAQLVIGNHVRSALKTIASADEQKAHSVAFRDSIDATKLMTDPLWNSEVDPETLPLSKELMAALAQPIADDTFKSINDFRLAVANFYQTSGSQGIDHIAELASAPRDADILSIAANWNESVDSTKAILDFYLKKLRPQSSMLALWLNPDEVRQQFSQAAQSGSPVWTHTQSVVISCCVGSALLSSGGHNLDAEVTNFVGNPSLERGSVNKLANGTIELNPEDLPRANELVRTAAREKTNEQAALLLGEKLREAPSQPAEPLTTVLALDDRQGSGRGIGRGYVPPPGEPPHPNGPASGSSDNLPKPGLDPSAPPRNPGSGSAGGGGNDGFRWKSPSDTPGNDSALLSGILMEKRDGKVFLYKKNPSGDMVSEAWNARDAHRAVLAELQAGGGRRGGKPLELFFGEGFDSGDTEAFLKSLRVQAVRYPNADPVLIFKELTPEASARLSNKVRQIAPASFQVSASPEGLQIIDGTLAITDVTGTKFNMTVETSLRGSNHEVTTDLVNAKVSATSARAITDQLNLKELGAAIYRDIGKLTPDRRNTSGVIRIEDVGDFSIVLEDALRAKRESLFAFPTSIQTSDQRSISGRHRKGQNDAWEIRLTS